MTCKFASMVFGKRSIQGSALRWSSYLTDNFVRQNKCLYYNTRDRYHSHQSQNLSTWSQAHSMPERCQSMWQLGKQTRAWMVEVPNGVQMCQEGWLILLSRSKPVSEAECGWKRSASIMEVYCSLTERPRRACKKLSGLITDHDDLLTNAPYCCVGPVVML